MIEARFFLFYGISLTILWFSNRKYFQYHLCMSAPYSQQQSYSPSETTNLNQIDKFLAFPKVFLQFPIILKISFRPTIMHRHFHKLPCVHPVNSQFDEFAVNSFQHTLFFYIGSQCQVQCSNTFSNWHKSDLYFPTNLAFNFLPLLFKCCWLSKKEIFPARWTAKLI